ncbi:MULTISPECIES: ECF transporter S component [Bifidobacterium]|uniref:ABC transporter permease n=1 Tax=Bifidobacterium myosotis TaxID=1630166 RepID=A0A261FKM1_9BIFI|nr:MULTISPECIES: ECF transporter S component [Bifidobacterium]KAA8829125.1 ABC transporter permease [Bifidobacterium myosotis]OZG59701.1 ABC transporter permease [Bifidobacterium myosotis]TPF94450.1 ABC transporter permease [Bifidobacterium sp. UTBIF-78]
MAQAVAKANYKWRVVDIVVASIVAVASGVIFAGWDLIYKIPTTALDAVLPGFSGLVCAFWLFAGPLAGLIVRKPGAAIYAELVAACIEYIIGAGNVFGISGSIIIGLVQGVFAELAFVLVLYRKWNPLIATLSGLLAGLGNYLYEFSPFGGYVGIGYFSTYGLCYLVTTLISGAVIAGVLMWYVHRAIAATGVLDRFESGRTKALV